MFVRRRWLLYKLLHEEMIIYMGIDFMFVRASLESETEKLERKRGI